MSQFDITLKYAEQLDIDDPLKLVREKFHIPTNNTQQDLIYLCGHSLGLQPKATEAFIQEELQRWSNEGVLAHFSGENPWFSYHELVSSSLARLVGAEASEVVAMNSLSANIHFLMVSFFRPTASRHKILCDINPFSSDLYILKSQLRFHGFDPETDLLQTPLQDILACIEEQGDQIAVVWLPAVDYLSGQFLEMAEITKAAHEKGCVIGFDLAHAAGNVAMNLHDWGVDFAAWCTYKYLNSGPGGIGACFVHEKHFAESLPRFEAWWGHNKERRFLMEPEFDAMNSAEAWQLSNPSILCLAALRASMAIFDEVGIENIVSKSQKLSAYAEYLLEEMLDKNVNILTPSEPQHRGSQWSLEIKGAQNNLLEELLAHNIVCDFREPNVLRFAPIALYNSFVDVYQFVNALRTIL